MGVSKVVYDGNTLVDLTNDTVTAAKMLSGTTAHDKSGAVVTGTIATKTSSNLTASGATVSVPAGYYASTASKAVATATQATPSITVSTAGLITASATQTAGYVAAGTKSGTKQLTVQAAQTITPGTSNKTIASGRYLTGTQTIKGDANLKAANIKSGVSIFGVSGSYTGATTPHAAIGVTYPVGSTCTCTNGTTTYTAPDTTGQCVFIIPSNGEWTVAAGTKSVKVNIVAKGQFESVRLTSLMLYDTGNQCTDLTGGWKVQNGSNAQAAINSDHLYMGYKTSATSSRGHAIHTNNPVVLSPYEYLKAQVNVTVVTEELLFGIVVEPERINNIFVNSIAVSTTGEQTISVPIAAYNSNNYYVLFQGTTTKATISKVWLE